MAKTSIYQDQYGFQGDGLPAGSPWTSGQIANTPSPASEQTVALTIGSNTFAVPPNTLWMKFIPSPTGVSKTWRGGVSGDTGTRMHPTLPFTYFFDPAALPANIYITATANESGYLIFG